MKAVSLRVLLSILGLALGIWLVLGAGQNVAAQERQGNVAIDVPAVAVEPWTAGGPTTTQVQGRITLDGAPVAGARVAVGGYQLPFPTDANGTFVYTVDRTLVRRHPVRVTDASSARVDGNPLAPSEREALQAAVGGVDVHYKIVDVATRSGADGTIVVSGSVQFANGEPPPPVVLYSYRLAGTVTDAAGAPVEEMVVSTQSSEFRWTFSTPSGPQGSYTSLYWPTEAEPFRVLLIHGNASYAVEDEEGVLFPLYHSAHMDVTLDRSTGAITVTDPVAIEGFIYDGLLVGVMQDGAPVQPISATWPDEEGRFELVLLAGFAGQTVQWWQKTGDYFSAVPAEPGGEIGLDEWPVQLDPLTPRGFARLQLPGG